MGNDKLSLYNQVRTVPKEAIKEIKAGRLKGYSDINPMWRIKRLTEMFGACGDGWYYDVVDKQVLNGADGVIAVFVDIKFYYKLDNGEWSMPIYGTGGNTFIAKESRGMYTNDEAFKMALTDALSVACKSLGVGADVYFEKDRTKYTSLECQATEVKKLTDAQVKRAYAIATNNNISNQQVKEWILKKWNINSVELLTKAQYDELCQSLEKGGNK